MVGFHKSTACRRIRRVSLALSRHPPHYVHLTTEAESAIMKQQFYQASDIPGIECCIYGTFFASSKHEYMSTAKDTIQSQSKLFVMPAISYEVLLGDRGYLLMRWLMTPNIAPITQQDRRFGTTPSTPPLGLPLSDVLECSSTGKYLHRLQQCQHYVCCPWCWLWHMPILRIACILCRVLL